MESIGIGLAGFGTVGAGVFKNLVGNRALLSQRLGVELDVRRIAVRDLARARSVEAPAELFTTNLDDLLSDPKIAVVVELMGGIEVPREFVRKALLAGKIVVTGNKALLAEHGDELFQLARERRTPIFYEAAVAGGIPIIKSVREAFVANQFESIHGILNGTSNYILTRMNLSGLDFATALAEAQEYGFAEADPTLDVNGWDAAHKAIILASLAYGFWVPSAGIEVSGIDKITRDDVEFSAQLGYTIKLLATIKVGADAAVEVRVCPTLIPKNHVLASVQGVFNAVWLRGDVVGESLFYGRGAGQDPTASAVIADIAEAVTALESPRRCYGFTSYAAHGRVKPPRDAVSQFYLRLLVDDRPGVLAQVAGILGEAHIGISSLIQPEGHEGDELPLVLMLHDATFGRMLDAVNAIAALDCVKETPALIPVETFSR